MCELEQEYLNDKMRSFTIYFGDLVNTLNPLLLENYEKDYDNDDNYEEEEEKEMNSYSYDE